MFNCHYVELNEYSTEAKTVMCTCNWLSLLLLFFWFFNEAVFSVSPLQLLVNKGIIINSQSIYVSEFIRICLLIIIGEKNNSPGIFSLKTWIRTLASTTGCWGGGLPKRVTTHCWWDCEYTVAKMCYIWGIFQFRISADLSWLFIYVLV